MNIEKEHNPRFWMISEIIYSLLVGLVALAISFWTFKENLRGIFQNAIPLAGDGILIGLFIKTSNSGSILNHLQSKVINTDMGWPGVLDFTNFPIGQLADLSLIRIFSNVSGVTDPAIIIHALSILKAFPIAIAALVFVRSLGIPKLLSAIIAVTYSISSFNLIRAEGHFFLGLTWSVPLGLTALLIAFRLSQENSLEPRWKQKRLEYLKICLLLLPVAFSAFYFVIFFILLTAFMLAGNTFIELNSLKEAGKQNSFREISGRYLSRVSSLALILLILITGIISQIFWSYRHNHAFVLNGVADRSPIESVIYGGTFEGFFFDAGKLVLNIANRQDLLNFFASRISWEGSQVGAISGFIAYIYLIFVFVWIAAKSFTHKREILWFKKFEPSLEFLFVTFTLVTALSLYFVSPLNFGISRIIPEIRAWGRLSIFISLLIPSLFGLFVMRFKKSKILAFSLSILMFAIPILETNYFRNYRPLSSDSSLNSKKTQGLRLETLSSLESKFRKGCSLFQAPIYPFPEYDRPDDNNIDYAQLDLPILDNGYFRWSGPAIKGTKNWSNFQALASVQPPFNRADLKFQIEYAQALSACGAIVDRSLLTDVEDESLQAMIVSSKPSCVHELPGEQFEKESRFMIFELQKRDCTIKASPKVLEFKNRSVFMDLLWQIDQPYGLEYIDQWQMFPNTSPIGLRLVQSENSKVMDLVFNIKVSLPKTKRSTNFLNFCVRKTGSVGNACQSIKLEKDNQLRLPVDPSYISTSVTKLEITLASDSATLIEKWGVVIQSRVKN